MYSHKKPTLTEAAKRIKHSLNNCSGTSLIFKSEMKKCLFNIAKEIRNE